jgi:DNA-binding transcriptional MerR regulator
MKNFLLLLKYLIKSYDLLLNLLHRVRLLLLLNHLRILGLSLEEVGDIMEDVEDHTGDIEVVGEVLMVVLGVVIMDIMVVLGEVLMDITVITDIMGIMVIMVKKDLLEVLRKVMVVLMVVEEENGEITLRNLKNKRCVSLLKSK